MTKVDLQKSLILSEEACQCQDHQDPNLESSTKSKSSYMNTKRKLLCLLFTAALALFSIVILSEQLIVRHLSRLETSVHPELTILTLDDWASHPDSLVSSLDSNSNSNSNWKSNGNVQHQNGFTIIEDGIYWASELEARLSPGPSDAQVQFKLQELRERKVQSLDKPDWLHCGRDKNRFVHFSDGGHACARFRANHAEFVQGEVMAFYLARLLGITNTPAVILSEVSSNQWGTVHEQQWPKNSIVALIEWLPNLTKTTMPTILRKQLLQQNSNPEVYQPIDKNSEDFTSLDETQLEHLVQWSDLVIFDYLTGNYDRMASMQDAAEKEDKPSILKETIHNLALSEDTGSLWYIDNESSFLDAYSLLYDDENTNGVRFKKFHKEMLKSSCVFRKKTINRLFAMKKSLDPAQLLLEFVNVNEPLFQNLPQIHSNSIFRQHFSQRIQEVWNWVQECQLRVNYRPLK